MCEPEKIWIAGEDEPIVVWHRHLTPDVEPVGPSKYFEVKKKPSVALTVYDISLDQAREQIKTELRDGPRNPIITSTYLYLLACATRVEISEKWESLGVSIYDPDMEGATGTIRPIDLLQVTPNRQTLDPGVLSVRLSEKNDADILLELAGAYRIGLSEPTNAQYRAVLQAKLASLRGVATNKMTHGMNASVAEDPGVLALLGMWDMFLFKFPNHDYSKARWGTLSIRYKDCAIIETIVSVATLVGKSWQDVASWALYPQIQKEFTRLLTNEDELDDSYGYAPYMKAFQLTRRSPYSVTVNPNIHLFCKWILCLAEDPRGLNAVMVKGAVVNEAVKSAFLFTLAWRARIFLTQGEHAEEGLLGKGLAIEEDETADADRSVIPKEPVPDLWARWIKSNGGEFPDRMKLHFQRIIEKVKCGLRYPRKNSIGADFVNYHM